MKFGPQQVALAAVAEWTAAYPMPLTPECLQDLAQSIANHIALNPSNLQARIDEWVWSTFGEESALNGQERTLRHVEESVELAQAVGLSREQLHRLVDYVFERPKGRPPQEAAGAALTLYAAASALGFNLEVVLERELTRVQDPVVIERCRRRQAEKREALRDD